MERFAVVDLGSNTFHLLITEKSAVGFKEIYRQRVYTKLAKGGSDKISEESYKKGIDCLCDFRRIMNAHDILAYKALGTAALRSASNGASFIQDAKLKADIDIQLIDGDQEATYISSGVGAAVDLDEQNHLIMDIGGGSVEFILLSTGSIIWKQSFPIGLAILKARFHKEEPMTALEKEAMQTFLDDHLAPLKLQLQKLRQQGQNIKSLIGASGSFEVLQAMLDLPKWYTHSYQCHVIDFFRIRELVMSKTAIERHQVKGLPKERVDLIVVAFFLMHYTIQLSKTDLLQISEFALKEGVIMEYYNS